MKNIILLISDTFRHDNLFDRAERPVRTPELDRFATTRATEVTGFYAGSYPTIPHRTDLTSGRVGWPWPRRGGTRLSIILWRRGSLSKRRL